MDHFILNNNTWLKYLPIAVYFYIRENRSHVDKYAYYLQHFRMGNGLTDFCLTAHIWLKHLWNVDASIFVQVVL